MRCIVSNKKIELNALIGDKVYYNIVDTAFFGQLGIYFDEDIYFKSLEFLDELKKNIVSMFQLPCNNTTAKCLEAKINEILNEYRNMGLLFRNRELVDRHGYYVLIHSQDFELLESIQ